MPSYRASLQTLGAIALLVAALACGKKNSSTPPSTTATPATIKGTITYKRVPLATDADGKPTGLVDATVADNLKSLPARGVALRVYQQIDQTLPDGTKVTPSPWVLVQAGVSDSTGAYSMAVVKDRPTMVEVLSTFSGGSPVHVIAEPGGIGSTTPAPDRRLYALRKAADGTAPAGDNAPKSTITADSTVDFTVGLNDEWWVFDPTTANNAEYAVTGAVLETSFPGRTAGLGAGSRILGIGDTIYNFTTTYGSSTPGSTLDLHYWPGRSEPLGSYIDYGPYGPNYKPEAFDANIGTFCYFGSLRGDAANDDAWDEGVIMPLLARNYLFAAVANRTFSATSGHRLIPPAAALTDLSPDLARIEGLADAMAANLLKSPYLADTNGTALAGLRDVRDISGLSAGQLSPYSAPAVRALTWEIILKANSLASPGTSTNWATINPLAALRFFMTPALTNGATDATARDIEPLNIYSQLKRLSEAQSTSEPVNLSSIFTDTVITSLATPFGITWPRPTTGAYASFASDWGTDPTNPFPAVTLSMAKASQVNGVYPNVSEGEVFYAGFSLNADKRCTITAAITPALGADAQLELDLRNVPGTFTFTGSGGTTNVITIPAASTVPFFQPLRLRLISPTTTQPDVTVVLTLTPSL